MMNSRRWITGLLLAICMLGVSGSAWAQKKGKEPPTRSVKGAVMDELEEPVARAVVQLKNTKTLDVKSFIADQRGAYYFHGLDPNVDYKIQARGRGMESRVRTVSSFDDRKEVIYNFKLKSKK